MPDIEERVERVPEREVRVAILRPTAEEQADRAERARERARIQKEYETALRDLRNASWEFHSKVRSVAHTSLTVLDLDARASEAEIDARNSEDRGQKDARVRRGVVTESRNYRRRALKFLKSETEALFTAESEMLALEKLVEEMENRHDL